MPILGEPHHAELSAFLRGVSAGIPRPKAIVVSTAHWEEAVTTVSSQAAPGMIYDYHGFPPESYQLQYPAPGEPQLARHIVELLSANNIAAQEDAQRGYDHGTFVPLLLMYPAADIPVVQVSLLHSLAPAALIAVGHALAPLREEGVLLVGSGMSFHNMRAFFSAHPATLGKSQAFDDWLTTTLTAEELENPQRQQRLIDWEQAPEARFCHPREEHLLPLQVCFGAASVASEKASKNFAGQLFGTQLSGFRWD